MGYLGFLFFRFPFSELLFENVRYGHLTWEWKKGIRSYLHPLLFAALYKVLAFLRLDTPLFMVLMFLVFISTVPMNFMYLCSSNLITFFKI